MNDNGNTFRRIKTISSIAFVLLININLLISGGSPIQPDFANFEPVSTNNMVNEFDGSFVYNLPILTVPGPNGSSYSITLSYHSGLCPESDASWVGYGWTLNPGSIIRNTKGYPDDYNETEIKYWNKVEPNTTLNIGIAGNLEFLSRDFPLSLSGTFQYNSYNGYSVRGSAGIDLGGYLNLGIGLSSTGTITGQFSHIYHPTRLLNDLFNLSRKTKEEHRSRVGNDYYKMLHFNNSFSKKYSNAFGYFISDNTPTSSNNSYYGMNISGEYKVNGMTFPFLGLEVGININYSTQRTEDFKIKKANGFLYSGNANEKKDENNLLMDYSVEKDSDYNIRKKFLGIPFGNPDYYSVTGEGVSGSFRAFHKKIGIFHPKLESSFSLFQNIGYASNIGFGFLGFGIDLNFGLNKYDYGKWNDWIGNIISNPWNNLFKSLCYEPTNTIFTNKKDEPVFFRFINDLASNIDFSGPLTFKDDHKVSSLDIKPSWFSYSLPNSTSELKILDNKRLARSAFIGYNTFEDFMVEFGRNSQFYSLSLPSEFGSIFPRIIAYNKRNIMLPDHYISFRQSERELLKNQIMEFSITNNEGKSYIYGLPVFSRNESDLNYGIEKKGIVSFQYNNCQVSFGVTPLFADKVIGEERYTPYVSMYLLTSVATPDYVDIKQDGFTPDDLGGYTIFNYNKTAGEYFVHSTYSSNWWYQINPTIPTYMTWYRWRTPYKGLDYSKNSLSDPTDDLASFSKGERENYYIQKIETKTHIAYFITNYVRSQDAISINLNGNTILLKGSEENRHDAWEACLIEYNNARNSDEGCGLEINKMRKLERIELYVKSEDYATNGGILTKKLQTTYFEYDYSLMQYSSPASGDYPIPNSEKIDENNSYGKLTLKKVWTEFEDVKEDKISPYIFDYEYKSRDYPNVGNFSEYKDYHLRNGGIVQLKQNPAYNPNNADRWANYQDDDGDGTSRKIKMNDWIDQTPSDNFDPAAWHLKEITLPSGGEIHIYYEENDYSYVQDRRAMVMTSINDYNHSNGGYTTFEINCQDLGYSASEINELLLLMKSQYLDSYNIGSNTYQGKKDKLYFKFLYSLIGINPNLDLSNCKSEYIDGFVDIVDIVPVPSSGPTTGISFKCKENSLRDLCKDFYLVKRSGKVSVLDNNCDPKSPNYNDPDGVLDHAYNFASALVDLVDMLVPGSISIYCAEVDVSGNSYIRVPVVKGKKGGGIRVKCIIMYDRFNKCIEESEEKPIAYGKEYIYKTAEGISSGVTTNEPKKGSEENSLHSFIKTIGPENLFSNYLKGEFLLSGDMKEEFSTPLGESILPAPQVGYSRIVEKNLFEGLTDEGYKITEYYTTKDYPFDKTYKLGSQLHNVNEKDYVKGIEYSDINQIDDRWIYANYSIFSFLDISSRLAQGYQFIQSNMNGQKKSEYLMGGNIYSDKTFVSSYTLYEYFEPCEQIPVYYDYDNIKMEFLGREIEFFQEARGVNEIFVEPQLEYDNLIITPLIPYFSFSYGLNFAQTSLNSHVTTKVIRYPAIIKSITSMNDGIAVKSENIAFDRQTGQPVITRMMDEFNGLDLAGIGSPIIDHDGSYYSYKFVAANEYESMSHKSDNEKKFISSISNEYNIKLNKIYKDNIHFLDVVKSPSIGGICIDLKDIFSEGDLIYVNENSNKAGYFHISSIQDNRIILEPLFSTFVPNISFANVDINIIRSGKTNQLSTVAGNLITYGQADESKIINKIVLPNTSTSSLFATGSVPALEITRRQNFLDQLNFKINSAKLTHYEVLDYHDPDLKIKFADGTCQPIDNINIRINYNDDNHTIEVCVDSTNVTIIDSTNHGAPLVSDLNELLNNVWSMNLHSQLINDREWIKCNDCESFNGDTVTFQKYWTSQSYRDTNLVEKSMDLIGFNRIKETHYKVLDTIVSGASFITNDFIQCQNGVDYKTFFYNINTFDTTVLTGRMKLEINGHIIEIVRQTDPYPHICQDSSFTIDTLTLDTLYNSITDCIRFDCKNFSQIGCSFDKDRPFWDAYMVLPFMDNSQRFITMPSDSNLPNKNNSLMYSYMELDKKFTERWGFFYCDSTDGWLYYKPLDSILYVDNSPIAIMQLYNIDHTHIPIVNRFCCFQFSPIEPYSEIEPVSHFKLNEEMGYQVEIDQFTVNYGSYNKCSKLCFEFCPDIYNNRKIEGVIKVDAITFSDNWENDLISPTGNDYLTGKKGKWRMDDSYLYKTTIQKGGNDVANSSARTYLNSGVFDEFENIFNWKYKDGNYKWLFVNSIDKYNEHGNAIESSDILNIKSSQIYGYDNTLPVMIIINSSQYFSKFESFEDKVGSKLSYQKSHTGFKSYGLPSGSTDELIFDNLIFDQQVINEGFLIKAWFKTEYNQFDENDEQKDHLSSIIGIYDGIIPIKTLNPDFIFKAQTGEWSLYEAKVLPWQLIGVSIGDICKIKIVNSRTLTDSVWVDDIKVIPAKAQSNCYVYNRNDFKVLASFDDQHFALMYQYNAKGDLIRKFIETERGIKTIAEAQYNTPKIERNATSFDCEIPGPKIETKSSEYKEINNSKVKLIPKKYSINKSDLLTDDSLAQGSLKQEILDVKITPEHRAVKILEGSPDAILSDSLSLYELDNNLNLNEKFDNEKKNLIIDSLQSPTFNKTKDLIPKSLNYDKIKNHFSDSLSKIKLVPNQKSVNNKYKNTMDKRIEKDSIDNTFNDNLRKEKKNLIKKQLENKNKK